MVKIVEVAGMRPANATHELSCHPLLKNAERDLLGLPPPASARPRRPCSRRICRACRRSCRACRDCRRFCRSCRSRRCICRSCRPYSSSFRSCCLSCCRCCRSRAGRGKRKARTAPKEAEAALRAFQDSASRAESDDGEGYGDLIKKRAEAAKCSAGRPFGIL
jgi:hypothetical protein